MKPQITSETKPFWEACNEERFIIQYCPSCDHKQFYPRMVCTSCYNDSLQWVESSGIGTIITFTKIYQTIHSGFREKMPYYLAVIALQEGPQVMANVMTKLDIYIGMLVEVCFEKREDQYIYQFRPMKEEVI